jgi:large subunit ribosomal protein L24
MKSAFSKEWGASSQRRKQRKYQYNAPYNVRSKFLHVHLDSDLRKKHETRSIRVRKGDTVKVLRGQFKGTIGKVDRVDMHKVRIYVSGVERPKRDGSKSLLPIHPSNVMITALVSDKKRGLQNG